MKMCAMVPLRARNWHRHGCIYAFGSKQSGQLGAGLIRNSIRRSGGRPAFTLDEAVLHFDRTADNVDQAPTPHP
jgi:hypothetical protein